MEQNCHCHPVYKTRPYLCASDCRLLLQLLLAHHPMLIVMSCETDAGLAHKSGMVRRQQMGRVLASKQQLLCSMMLRHQQRLRQQMGMVRGTGSHWMRADGQPGGMTKQHIGSHRLIGVLCTPENKCVTNCEPLR